MEFHSFAEPWPLLEGQKFDELVADIKAFGLRQPITVYQQKILDGRNRFRACVKAGVAPRFKPADAKTDHDALMESTSLNKHRRHMSEDALAFVAGQLANLEKGENAGKINTALSKERTSSHGSAITVEEAANAVGVSPAHVTRARAIQKHAPDLRDKVLLGKRKGGMTMSDAAEEAYARARAKKGIPRKTIAEIQAINAAKAIKPTRTLLRRDVDPEFVGDEIAFVTEYGHVWSQTSQERSTSRLHVWALGMRTLARSLPDLELPRISPTVLSWLRKPNLADVERMRSALAEIELAVATARDLLDRAEAATVERQAAE